MGCMKATSENIEDSSDYESTRDCTSEKKDCNSREKQENKKAMSENIEENSD
jgi:hypothetical protein